MAQLGTRASPTRSAGDTKKPEDASSAAAEETSKSDDGKTRAARKRAVAPSKGDDGKTDAETEELREMPLPKRRKARKGAQAQTLLLRRAALTATSPEEIRAIAQKLAGVTADGRIECSDCHENKIPADFSGASSGQVLYMCKVCANKKARLQIAARAASAADVRSIFGKTMAAIDALPPSDFQLDFCCTVCARRLTPDQFQRHGRIGRSRECKRCSGEMDKCRGDERRANPRPVPPDSTCSKCGETKLADQFYRRPAISKGLSSRCIVCARKEMKEAQEFLATVRRVAKCAICSYNAEWRALEFAHFSRATKRRKLNGRTIGISHLCRLKYILEELPKGRWLCRFCHRLETRDENSDRKLSAADGSRSLEYVRNEVAKRSAVVNAEKLRRVSCLDCYRPVTIDTCPAFDFDHRDRRQKDASVCEMVRVRRSSLPEIMAEMEKCDLRCAICHCIKTIREGDCRPLSDSDDGSDESDDESDHSAQSETDTHTDLSA